MQICKNCGGLTANEMKKCNFCGCEELKAYDEPHAPKQMQRGAMTKPASRKGRRTK